MSGVRHYLDYNATAPLRAEARAAMLAAMDAGGNGSSVHAEGRRARALVERAREQVAALCHASPDQIVFTSGGTEANNAALNGVAGRIGCTADAHDSVLKCVAGTGGTVLPVEPSGLPSAELDLLTVTPVNNETGVISDLPQHIAGRTLHADAVQVPGKLDMSALQSADLISLSAHKIGGPAGVGALVVRREISPFLLGGGQEQRRRAGTENLIGIVGFGAAAAALTERWPEESDRISGLRDQLEERLLGHCPEAVIHGSDQPRAPNTTCIRMPGVSAETQVMALDLAGVAVSAGSACSSGKVTPSHVLMAMGVPESEAAEAIRISLGWATTVEDIDACAHAWGDLWQRKRSA